VKQNNNLNLEDAMSTLSVTDRLKRETDRLQRRMDRQVGTVINGHKVTVGALRKAFDLVCDPKDWKEPIHAVIPRKRWEITREAIIFFTATEPWIVSDLGNLLVIHAIGYRRGPAW
jgi:hypothetical protein